MKEARAITIIALIVILLFSLNYFRTYDYHFSPPFEPPRVVYCSNSSIKAVWDAIFEVSSNGVAIIVNSTDTGVCNNYYAYKMVSDETYVLGGSLVELRDNVSQVVAMKGNFTSKANALITGITEDEVDGQHMIVFTSIAASTVTDAHPKNISSIQQAKSEFDSVFKPENASAFAYDSTEKAYNFSYESISGDDSLLLTGSVFAMNYTLIFSTLEIGDIQIACISNWVAVEGNCTSSETYNVWYKDTNSCPNATGAPDNKTSGCDYDKNGIIGTETDINETNINVELYIKNNKTNYSAAYKGSLPVELREGDISRVSFTHDFSDSPLNLKKIKIEKQVSSSNRGYLILSGVSDDKTFIIDKLASHSSKVCVKDQITTSISDSCTGSYENLVECPGNKSGFVCSIDNDTFTISGLKHSAVKEFLGQCAPNWNCTEWSACVANEQTRACTDLNNCGIVSGKPSEVQVCTSCISEWECTGWEPALCPEEEIKTRTCTDKNSCGVDQDKPPEEKQCIYKTTIWYLVAIITAIALVALIVVISAVIALNKENVSREKRQRYQPPTRNLYPSPEEREHIKPF